MSAAMPRTSDYAVLFRTHFWDAFAQRQFERLMARAAGCDVYVVVDETAGPVDGISHDRIMRHTELDVLDMGLPRAGEGNLLWFNGDYPLYLFVRRHPGYSYLLQLEYDAVLNQDVAPLLARMQREGLDFVGLTKGDAAAPWPWERTCRGLYDAATLRHQLICVSAFSADALEYLRGQRLLHAAKLQAERISAWPMCEAFIATELAVGGFRIAELSQFGSTGAYDHWPPFLENELPAMAEHDFVHPVLDEPRYVDSMLKYHVGLEGYLHVNSLFHRKLRRLPPGAYARALVSSFLGKASRVLRQAVAGEMARNKTA
jgi:hypothetical protein